MLNNFLKKLVAAAAGLCFVFIALPGCSVTKETVRTEYVYRDRVQVDTTVLKDSIFIEKYIRGDTVRIVEYRDHLVYQYRMLRDTVAVHDTTAVETVREVKVERSPTWWEKVRLRAFPWLLLAVAGLGLWTFRKFLI